MVVTGLVVAEWLNLAVEVKGPQSVPKLSSNVWLMSQHEQHSINACHAMSVTKILKHSWFREQNEARM